MKHRHLSATAALACAVLALTACSSAKTPVAAGDAKSSAPASATPGAGTTAAQPTLTPSTSASQTQGQDQAPSQPAPTGGAIAVAEACRGSEQESDVSGVLTGTDRSATPRVTGIVKLTNTSTRPCELYGPADVRTTGPTVTKLVTAVLGDVEFPAGKGKGTVLQPGKSAYQAVSWLESPPTAPNAECTTGDLLILARNDGAIDIKVPAKGARFCPVKESGSAQVAIGAPLADEAQARVQLEALSTKKR
ncbi:DUF4232 domain-containing protein [Kitasatospora sp. NPDC096147]|uniref:DUF4232 domain-containing protein n=1 Tax=Kitasatospora sp. NPDC096147 TaxID=3364093 RepID=UPI0037F7A1DF